MSVLLREIRGVIALGGRHRAQYAAPDAVADHFEKEVLNRLESGGGSRGVVGDPA